MDINRKSFMPAFLINAAILASISVLTIETRFAINGKDEDAGIIGYYLRYIPYKVSKIFKLLSKDGIIPEWIKLIYMFFISFIIALIVYYTFAQIFGYKKLYKFFFGNF